MSTKSLIPDADNSLRVLLLQESEAMARYASSNGIAVDGALMQQLESYLDSHCELSSENGVDPADRSAQNNDQNPESNPVSLAPIAALHNRLSKLISPAKPGTLFFLEREKSKVRNSFLRYLGPVPLVRQLMFTAITCVTLLISFSLSIDVNTTTASLNVFEMDGIPLLMNLLFLLAAAGLGASFANLFRVNRYLVDGTYDPKHDASYWSRFVLGMIAGLILVEFIPFESGDLGSIARPTLAILGGFSASVVYRILDRLVDSIESIVRGERREIQATREKAAQISLELDGARQQLSLTNQVQTCLQKIDSGASNEEISGHLKSLLQEINPSSAPIRSSRAQPQSQNASIESNGSAAPESASKEKQAKTQKEKA